MRAFTRVELQPHGPFHFGGRGIGLEHSDVGLAADSLFSALCVKIAETEGSSALVALLDRFQSDKPPFCITSLFPYAASVRFLPFPLIGMLHILGAADIRTRKRFKAVRWVSEAVFTSLAKGEVPSLALQAGRPTALHDGAVWLEELERQSLLKFTSESSSTGSLAPGILWKTVLRPRASIDRIASTAVPYGVGSTHFNRSGDSEVGLYCVIHWREDDTALRDTVRRAFDRLGESGVGGRRSSGHGQFSPRFFENESWSVGAGSGSHYVTLSPFHPRPDEISSLGPGARYDISLHRGWLSLPGFGGIRRSSVRMVSDASVIRSVHGKPPIGGLVDVSPVVMGQDPVGRTDAEGNGENPSDTSHVAYAGPRIWRYGFAFPIPVADSEVVGAVKSALAEDGP